MGQTYGRRGAIRNEMRSLPDEAPHSNPKQLTLTQKSTASPMSAESASLQLPHAILRQAAIFVGLSVKVLRYFFLQRVK